MTTKEARAEAAADARAEAKADAKADAAEARAADRAEAKAAGTVKTEGYVLTESGQVKKIVQGHVAIEVVSDFIAHNRKPVSKGDRLTVPRALGHAMIHAGNARELTAEEYGAGEATPAGAVDVADPSPTTRDPSVRKR
jgi:hypothetical protein